MRNIPFNRHLLFTLAVLASGLALLAAEARAGGPLLVRNGQATRWARGPVQGGPLNSQTVDANGRVLYRVDSGPLGPLPNEKAVAFVDRIFRLYTEIPTATIEFVNAGLIKDPATGEPIDVNGTNYGRLRTSQSFQNMIIFDSDGAITGGGGVLGFFGFVNLDQNTNELKEGIVVLNGASVASVGGEIPFLGVFTHEFGHFAGPLDHAQINGDIASGNAALPGYSQAQAFDLLTPFTETLYPFLFGRSAPPGSVLANSGFGRSGFYIASLDLDTRNALSDLYPAPGYSASDPGSPNGAIEGRVVIRTTGGDIPITGINVIARRISRGAYPPALGAEAFPGFPAVQFQVDADGVPLSPPDQDSTDSLSTAASAVTGLNFGVGRYRIDGLPPGQYLLEIQQINPGAVGGSSIGPLDEQFPLPVAEFYSGPRESGEATDLPTDFEPIFVNAGSVVTNIDIVLNGVSSTGAALINEREPNDKTKKAQRLELPVEVTGSAAFTDGGQLKIEFGNQPNDTVEDLYRFTVDAIRTYFIILEPINGGPDSDLDLYVFNSTVPKKKVSINSPAIEGLSAGASANELIAVRLIPGNYIVGVSAFDGTSVGYRMRIIATQ